MRKSLFNAIVCLLLLTFVSSSSAMLNLGAAGGGVGPSSECPSWYASCVFSWDGQSSLGNTYGCEQDGTPVNGSLIDATISTSYGEGGDDQGIIISDQDEFLKFTGDYFPGHDSDVTVWLRMKYLAFPDNNVIFFEAYDSTAGDYVVGIKYDAPDEYVVFQHDDGTTDNVAGTNFDANTWEDIGYTLDISADTQAVYDTDDAWEVDNEGAGDLLAFDAAADYILIGQNNGGVPGSSGAGNEIYVTQMCVMTGYSTTGNYPW